MILKGKENKEIEMKLMKPQKNTGILIFTSPFILIELKSLKTVEPDH